MKALVRKRARFRCEYCLSPEGIATQDFSVEHIFPKSKGGTSESSNLALSCQGCNGFKYAKTSGRDPVDNEITELYHPRTHLWIEHFAWSENYAQLLGLTAIGRATIETLHLNRPSVVKLRRLLFLSGEHPQD